MPVQSPRRMAVKLWPLALATSGANAMAPGWQVPVVRAGWIGDWFGAAVADGTNNQSEAQVWAAGNGAALPTARCRM